MELKPTIHDVNDLPNEDMFSFQTSIIAEIVKEQDEHIMLMIEEYVKEKQHKGECVSARIIPEGKLRHIINLGLTVYNAREKNIPDSQLQLFPQEEYIEYLRHALSEEQKENQKLKNQISMMENPPEIVDLRRRDK